MKYIELTVNALREEDSQIIIAILSDAGFEGFIEDEKILKAYVADHVISESLVREKLHGLVDSRSFSFKHMADRNWNSVWEADYQPVTISNKVIVRASFHNKPPEITHDIIIDPRMAFGTGHHDSTRLMIEALLKQNVFNMKVLDMGCGTGVLSILASKLGASSVLAVDNNNWAYENARENIAINGSSNIQVNCGDVSSLPNSMFDLCLANINRNVLMEDIPVYSGHLAEKALLIISGYLVQDQKMIDKVAVNNNLLKKDDIIRNDWCCSTYSKK